MCHINNVTHVTRSGKELPMLHRELMEVIRKYVKWSPVR